MTPEPNQASSQAALDGLAEDATMATREAAEARQDDTSAPAGVAAESVHRVEAQAMPPEAPRVSKLRRSRPSDPATSRRLGPFEYTLLALVALGIAITLAMAILNPS